VPEVLLDDLVDQVVWQGVHEMALPVVAQTERRVGPASPGSAGSW
jgi:hypothetical protein